MERYSLRAAGVMGYGDEAVTLRSSPRCLVRLNRKHGAADTWAQKEGERETLSEPASGADSGQHKLTAGGGFSGYEEETLARKALGRRSQAWWKKKSHEKSQVLNRKWPLGGERRWSLLCRDRGGVGCDCKNSQQGSLWNVPSNSFSLRRKASPRLSRAQREMMEKWRLKLRGGGWAGGGRADVMSALLHYFALSQPLLLTCLCN